MTLDRQDIEKKDFPIARRGYDPDAVDAHLTEVAEQVSSLQRGGGGSQGGARESLALAASRQVQAIVEAAESSAAEIESAARSEAQRIRQEADDDARQTRDEATRNAQQHVGEVREATSLMLQRVDAMEQELGALIESLRTGANRLTADLSLLQGNLGELQTAAAPVATSSRAERRAAEQAAAAASGPEPAVTPTLDTSATPVEPAAPAELAAAAPPPPVDPAPPAPEPAAAADPVPAGDGDGDVEGARLIALNMALNGASREEADAYLAENFDLADRGSLLDEVYATVDG